MDVLSLNLKKELNWMKFDQPKTKQFFTFIFSVKDIFELVTICKLLAINLVF